MDPAPVAQAFSPTVTALGIWLGALLTLAIYSFLYRDNPIYKLAEHIFVGVSAGYYVGVTFWDTAVPKIWQPLFDPIAVGRDRPDWLVIPPALLGLLIFTRFFPRAAWLARLPICFIIGAGAGVAIPTAVQAFVLKQVSSTMVSLYPHEAGQKVAQSLIGGAQNLLLIAGVIAVLCYFYFSKAHRGALGVGARLGIWLLMIAFGATFGNTVMARISLLIGRLRFLHEDWGPMVGLGPEMARGLHAQPWRFAVAGAILLALLALLVRYERRAAARQPEATEVEE